MPRRLTQLRTRVNWGRWWDRITFGATVILWLFVTTLVFAFTVLGGIAVLIAGVIYVVGEIWINARGDRHPRFVVFWFVAWHFFWGVALIAVAAIYLRWESVVVFVFGVWQLALAAIGLVALWRERSGGLGTN